MNSELTIQRMEASSVDEKQPADNYQRAKNLVALGTRVLKLEFAGSGDHTWRWKNPDVLVKDYELRALAADDFKKLGLIDVFGQLKLKPKEVPRISKREKHGVPIYTISGPLGGAPEGAADKGANSISRNIEYGKKLLESFMERCESKGEVDKNSLPIVRIKGHSRGAVAASFVSNWGKENYGDNLRVESVHFDPVTGPKELESLGSIDLKVNESTVVYSLDPGKKLLNRQFQAQRVKGAKRIIWTHRPHHVGLEAGVEYDDHLYRNFRLNALEPGEYFATKRRLVHDVQDHSPSGDEEASVEERDGGEKEVQRYRRVEIAFKKDQPKFKFKDYNLEGKKYRDRREVDDIQKLTREELEARKKAGKLRVETWREQLLNSENVPEASDRPDASSKKSEKKKKKKRKAAK